MFFFFNDTATTEIYTLSLHDALPISRRLVREPDRSGAARRPPLPGTERRGHRLGPDPPGPVVGRRMGDRSEEHTSELQSRQYLVCRLLLEKKKLFRVRAVVY